MNRKAVYSITLIVIALIAFCVLKTVPFLSVIESFGTQEFTIEVHQTAITTLIVKKGWEVQGSYSEANDVGFQFLIYAADGSLIFEKTGPKGSFIFVSEGGGSYKIRMNNSGYKQTIVVTLEATQTGKTTII